MCRKKESITQPTRNKKCPEENGDISANSLFLNLLPLIPVLGNECRLSL